MSGTLISASYGEEDQSLGIKFEQVKAYGDTIHIRIDALRPELQQKFPQLVRGPASLSGSPSDKLPADAAQRFVLSAEERADSARG